MKESDHELAFFLTLL